jgi:enoyl-CoA hydratase
MTAAVMPYEKITYDVRAGVATVALDDPDTRNALSDELLGELLDALAAARDDDAVRCVVLTSTHATVFSSGGNLGGFAADVALAHKHIANERFPAVFRMLGQLGQRACARRRARPRAGV